MDLLWCVAWQCFNLPPFILAVKGQMPPLGALDAVVTAVNNVQHRATPRTALLFNKNNMLHALRG